MKKIVWLLILVLTLGLVGCELEDSGLPSQATSTPLSSPIISGFEEFMRENHITLTAKDVQYDMVNKLNKSFAIEGYAKLSDYYNYGFDDVEKDYFVIWIAPTGGNYLEGWYLYCHRDSFQEFFKDLKLKDEVLIEAKCKIPLNRYENGQGNLAILELVSWY